MRIRPSLPLLGFVPIAFTCPIDPQPTIDPEPLTLAVIGDTPYGSAQVEAFPGFVAALEADPDTDVVVHVGDIKTGSSRCDDTYFAMVFDQFATLSDPLVYTPGDNEWTDCHRSAAGRFDPIERLAAIREVFFAEPEESLGGTRLTLATQADDPRFAEFPENQRWQAAGVVLATLHVVGSNNGLAPWFTDDATDEFVDDPSVRIAEVEARTAAAVAWLDETFDTAEHYDAAGVVIFSHADMWDGSPVDGFDAIVERLAQRTAAFEGPVLIIQGDSHRYLVDQPLADGSPMHGVEVAAPNLTRIVVEGENTAEWLRLDIDPNTDAVFAWQRVPLQ